MAVSLLGHPVQLILTRGSTFNFSDGSMDPGFPVCVCVFGGGGGGNN